MTQTTTVYTLALTNGIKFRWIIGPENQQRIPVIEREDGTVDLINDPVDNLKLCDALDAILEERRKNGFVGITEDSPCVVRERRVVNPGPGRWIPDVWRGIVFEPKIDPHLLASHQSSVDYARNTLHQ